MPEYETEQYDTEVDTEVETDEPEAPEPVEPEAVTVEPAETPSAPGLLDKFEVTAERGHRLKG